MDEGQKVAASLLPPLKASPRRSSSPQKGGKGGPFLDPGTHSLIANSLIKEPSSPGPEPSSFSTFSGACPTALGALPGV
jgi:hypothetical protein